MTMTEHVRRTDVICAIKKYEIEHCPEYMQDWVTKLKLAMSADILDSVLDIPAADVAEVVRCKDCKHWKHFDHLGCTDFVKVCGLANYMIGAEGFCLYGERQGGDANG